MKDLSELRTLIRQIDEDILRLVAKRLDLAREIGQVKSSLGLPIKDYNVEREVLERGLATAKAVGLYGELAQGLLKLLVHYSVIAQDERQARARGSSGPLQKRVTIVGGRGRMGLWLADFLAAFGHAVTLLDVEVSDGDFAISCQSADVVLLSTPIGVTGHVLEKLTKLKVPGLVFDICSLKSPLLPAMRKALDAGIRLASAHPMFGPDVEVLAGRNIVICDCGHQAATQECAALFQDSTANIVRLPLARHDELMAYVLGQSHLTSLVFARALAKSGFSAEELGQVSSTTFNAQVAVSRPVTEENQDLYYEIQAANHFTPEVLKGLDQALKDFTAAIAAGDRGGFKTMMDEGRRFWGGQSSQPKPTHKISSNSDA